MNSRRHVILTLFVVVGILTTGLPGLMAQTGSEKMKSGEVALPKVVEATITGNNFCTGCTLKNELGAKSQCSIHGHTHALRVSEAVSVDGKKIPWLQGWVLQYLGNDAGKPFAREHQGETLTLSGKVYTDMRIFEVTGDGAKASEKKKAKPEHPKSEHPKSEPPSGEHPN